MNWLKQLLSDGQPLSPQASMGALTIVTALFVWAVVSFWLAFSGNFFAYYGELVAGCFGMLSVGTGLLGYHLAKTGGGSCDGSGTPPNP